MNLLPSPELILFGPYDRGVPNQERIVLRAALPNVDLTYFGLVLAMKLASGAAVPIIDNFFWFGNGLLNEGDWICVYTSPGTAHNVPYRENPANKVYNLYWGRRKVAFLSPDMVPLLFKFDSVVVGASGTPQLNA